MNPEIKAKWLAALRGGQYAQATGTLRSEDGERHCCLGVLCDIVEPDEWRHNDEYCKWWHRDSCELASLSVANAADIEEDSQITLAKLNDSGETFAEIADFIEANL